MADRKETIIIDVQLTGSELGKVATEINKLKDANRDLKKDIRDGNATWQDSAVTIKENEIKIKQLTSVEKELTGQLAISTSANRKYGDSNDAVRAQVADLERQYNSLSNEVKNTEAGKALLAQQNELKASMKANAQELGNYQDEVGNYKNALTGASNSISGMRERLKDLNSELDKMDIDSSEFKETRNTIDNLSLAVDQASGKVDEFGNREPKNIAKRQFEDTLITVSILSSAIGGLSQAFGENENVQEALLKTQKALVLSQTVANVVKEKGAILDTIILAKDKALIASKFVLTNVTRIFGVTSAQAWALATLGLSLLITGIVLLISNFEKITSSLKSFFGVTDQFKDVRTDIDNASKALEGFGENTKLVEDRLKAQGATEQAVLNFRKNRFNEQLTAERKIISETSKMWSSATDEEKERAKQAADFIKNSTAEKFKFETEQIILIKSQREEASKKHIENDKKEQESAKAIRQARQEVLKSEQESEKELAAFKLKTLKENADAGVKTLEDEAKLFALKNQERLAWQKLTDDQLFSENKKSIQKTYDDEINKLNVLLDNKQITLSEYNKSELVARQQLNTDVAVLTADNEARIKENKLAAQAADFQNEFAIAQMQGQSLYELQLQQLESEEQAEIDAAIKRGDNVLLIEEKYAEQKRLLAEQTEQARLDIASGFVGNLSTIFGKETALGKGAAAAQIAIDTYKGAMSAYSALAAFPPAAIAAAAAVGVVGAASIKKTLSVKEKFADGGIVGGSSYTGDKVIAGLNSGEMIFNRQQQQNLFNMIATDRLSASNGIDYELLAKAVSKIPAPVMNYKEFTDFQQKIATFDERIKI